MDLVRGSTTQLLQDRDDKVVGKKPAPMHVVPDVHLVLMEGQPRTDRDLQVQMPLRRRVVKPKNRVFIRAGNASNFALLMIAAFETLCCRAATMIWWRAYARTRHCTKSVRPA